MGKCGVRRFICILVLFLLTGCSKKTPDAASQVEGLDAYIQDGQFTGEEGDGNGVDVPEEAEQNTQKEDVHIPAEISHTVADSISGYCGNTVTTLWMGMPVAGEGYTFWGTDSVSLTDILINLAYEDGQVCRCPVEYVVDTEFGTGYGVNLTECFARYEGGQVSLTQEQVETIADIISRQTGDGGESAAVQEGAGYTAQ